MDSRALELEAQLLTQFLAIWVLFPNGSGPKCKVDWEYPHEQNFDGGVVVKDIGHGTVIRVATEAAPAASSHRPQQQHHHH
jgi:hypothetical protein